MIYYSEKLSWPEFKDLANEGAIAVIAVGAHEEHGPHCSLATDSIISNAFAERIANRINGILLPKLSYGDSWSIRDFPGTISLEPETLHHLLMDIAHSIQRAGVRAIIFVNGHFDNMVPIEMTMRRLRLESDYPSLVINFPDLEKIAAEINESKPAGYFFFHADEFETSVVLSEFPEGVKMDKAAPVYPDFPPDYGQTKVMISSFNPIGVFGDPTKATAEKGKRFLDALEETSMKQVETFLEQLDKKGPKHG